RYWLDDEGVLHAENLENAEVTIEDAREALEVVWALIGGVPRPMLGDITKLRSISRDARKLFASVAAERYTDIAIVVASPRSRALGNFLLGMHKARVPTRLFSSAEEGLAWLREQTGKQ